MQYRRISADCHLDMIWLPPDLFTSGASRALKDQMPYVKEQPDGTQRWIDNNGPDLGKAGGVGAVGSEYVPGKQLRVDKMHEAGLYDDFINNFCSYHPDREIGLACLPYSDIDAAAAEVRRVAKLGMRGVELSCSWHMTPMWHPMWDPLWEAINEVQLPLHFHTFPAADPKLRASLTGNTLRAMTYSGLCRFQMTLATILTDLMGAAVFERFPNIRVVLGESGIGWIPYVLDRMDFDWWPAVKPAILLRSSSSPGRRTWPSVIGPAAICRPLSPISSAVLPGNAILPIHCRDCQRLAG